VITRRHGRKHPAAVSDPLNNFRPKHCPACDYDLTGLPEPRCPECGFACASGDVLIHGWHEKRYRRPLWLRALETTASSTAALIIAVAGYLIGFVFASIQLNPLALFAAVVSGAIVTRMFVAAMFRDRVAKPNLAVVISESGISMRPSISRFGAMLTRPWPDLSGITIKPLFWRPGLYRMRFNHKRTLDNIVAFSLYFDADDNAVQALRERIRHFLPVA
jgi:hypothetical protein